MATIQDLNSLRKQLELTDIPPTEISKTMAYLTNAIRDEQRKDKKPISSNTVDQLYTLTYKFWNLGAPLDGTNAIIAGRNFAMATFHGYKNKVLKIYPETEFDIQLVREGDETHFAKESGSVVYTHNIADPFGTHEASIIGAYVVFKNKRGEYLETLNKTDYDKMRRNSGQQKLWDMWESEFWLKSVIKRACKRHFNDITEDLDKFDNENKAPDEPVGTPEMNERVQVAIEQINAVGDAHELNSVFQATGLMNNKLVVEAYRAKRVEVTIPKDTRTA
jgi:hypothetical protein